MADNTTSNFNLLVKLLKMTTSSNDGEAITAMRKANEQASKFGGWERILLGQITIVEDPFEKIATPESYGGGFSRGMNAPPKPKPSDFDRNRQGHPASPAAPTPPPPRAAHPSGFTATPQSPSSRPSRAGSWSQTPIGLSVRSNKFSGSCFCCGTFVNSHDGGIFKPHDHNPSATTDWKIICSKCNAIGSSTVPSRPAKRQRASTSDILNGL